jgi:uncharacterized protein YecE (DUF72 family)
MTATRGRLLVGTAGWTDPTLIRCKCFYPAEAKSAEDRLRYYASQFPMVEVDSTYYSISPVDNAVLWSLRTPPDFTFDIKAFRLFTLHQTPLNSLPSEVREEAGEFVNSRGNVYLDDLPDALVNDLWQRFHDSLAPLKSAGKLGYVLLQFPQWVTKRRQNLRYLEKAADRLEGHTVAIEFRHKSWLGEEDRRETLAFLREQNLALVIVDEPQGFNSSVPAIWEATSPDLSVVRFHCRNSDTWMKRNLKSAAERFDYLYSSEELQGFVEPVQRLREQSREVHAVFNNCMEDKAVRNAKELADLLARLG